MKESPLVVYCYYFLTDVKRFCDALEKEFRRTGHTRPLEFKAWDCYEEPPGRDADILMYDGVVMSALVEKGYCKQIPEIIHLENVFPWVLDRSRIKGKMYGVPFLLCSNVLICRKEDYYPVKNIYEIKGKISAPLKSMAAYYQILAFCSMQEKKGNSIEVIKELKRILGDEEKYQHSSFSNYDGVTRFKNGESQFLLGFSEELRHLEKGTCAVQPINFSNAEKNELPLIQCDYISMSPHVSEEKLLDCLDMMEIITNPSFIKDICAQDGRLEYMLPADRSVYPELAEIDPIYNDLFCIANNEDNNIMRYNKDYYEEFPYRKENILSILADTKE